MDLRVVLHVMGDVILQDRDQVQRPMVVSYTEMVAHTDDMGMVN